MGDGTQANVAANRQQGNIVPATAPGGPLEIEYVPRNLKMIQISTSELDSVVESSGSIHVGFLGISLGGLVSFGVTLATVPIEVPTTKASIVALTGLSAVLSLFFAARATMDHFKAKKRVKALKGE